MIAIRLLGLPIRPWPMLFRSGRRPGPRMRHGTCSASCPTCGGFCVRVPQTEEASHRCVNGHTW